VLPEVPAIRRWTPLLDTSRSGAVSKIPIASGSRLNVADRCFLLFCGQLSG
jgi:hypothetical protein